MPLKMLVETCDMHVAGEPLRIVKSGYPNLEGSTVLEKRAFAKTHHDEYRKFLMLEPRGHYDMYGAIVLRIGEDTKNEIGVLFIQNEGYSPMCGHGVIGLGRYAVDHGLVQARSPETELVIHCPCGPVKTFVEYVDGRSGRVKFHSVPAFVFELDVEVSTKELGDVKVDISYGGAFYAFIDVRKIGMNLEETPLSQLVNAASDISEAVKRQVVLQHPQHKDLEFLYGTILTDGKDEFSDGLTKNICVFAAKEVDRSPTGSGVTARVALQWTKGLLDLGQMKEFKGVSGRSFTGKPIEATKCGPYHAVVVEVSGRAYYTGDHVFKLEEDDDLGFGFLLPR